MNDFKMIKMIYFHLYKLLDSVKTFFKISKIHIKMRAYIFMHMERFFNYLT